MIDDTSINSPQIVPYIKIHRESRLNLNGYTLRPHLQFQKLGELYLEHVVVQACSLVLVWLGSFSLLTDQTALVVLIIIT